MKRDGIGKSPYGGMESGKLPERGKPNDRKKKSSNTVTYTFTPNTTPLQATVKNSWVSGISGISWTDTLNAYSKSFNANFSFTMSGTASRETEFASLGFAAGVVRGVRSFSVDDLGRLTGIHFKQVWKPGENKAECRSDERKSFGDFGTHLPDCVCGFYAYYDGSNDYRNSGETITAVVEGYGSTVIGTRGFRCSKARVVALHIPDSVKRSGVVSRNYAEIPQFDSFLRMIQEYPPIGDEKTTSPNDEDFWERKA